MESGEFDERDIHNAQVALFDPQDPDTLINRMLYVVKNDAEYLHRRARSYTS